MAVREGTALKSNLTGKVYRVKAVRGMAAVLEAEDGTSSVITEIENLKLFYKRIEKGETSEAQTCCGKPVCSTLAQA